MRLGGGEAQVAGMGVELGERRARFEGALDVVRRLLAGEEVSTSGPWRIERARIGPTPPEPVEVWVGAAAAPALSRAARLGDAWIAGPYATGDELAGQVAQYREACRGCGRRPLASFERLADVRRLVADA